MKKKKKLLIALLVFLVPAIGFGYNYFSWNQNQTISEQAMTVAGEITVNEISPSNKLVPGDKIYNEVGFNIDSTAVSLLRVKVDSYYSDNSDAKDGEKQSKKLCCLEGIDPNWIDGGDGYYYYNKGVSNNNSTVPFVKNICFDVLENEDANNYQDKYIYTDITAEMVQAKYGVFEEKWEIQKGHPAYDALQTVSNEQGE